MRNINILYYIHSCIVVFTEEVASLYVDYIALPQNFLFQILENNTHMNICLVKLQITLG